jgi:hypothetical protein
MVTPEVVGRGDPVCLVARVDVVIALRMAFCRFVTVPPPAQAGGSR